MKKKIKIIIKIILVVLYIALSILLWNCKDYVLLKLMKIEQYSIIYYVHTFGIGIILAVILLALIITLKRFNIAIKNEEKGTKDTNLKNNNDEYIRCKRILDGKEPNQKIYEIDAKNISLNKMKARQDDLEAIYDIKIDYMEYGKTTKTINIYCTPRKYLKPKQFDIWADDHFLDDFLSALVVGGTGSGKTYFTHQLLGKIVYNKSISVRNNKVIVFICDRKNEDFIQFKDYPNYYGINAIDGIRKVHKIFMERLNNDESNENKETIICLIEEYALLLNSLDKKEAEEVKNMVADLLFAGRSKKVITIVSGVRIDI